MGRALELCVLLLLASACGGGWAWTPVEGTVCANGTATGMGLRTGTSDDLLIYLEGGGACWDQDTCYKVRTAWNVDGYGEAAFGVEPLREADIFDLMPDATHVFIPYCTADLHSGTATREYSKGVEFHHAGALNLDAFLKVIPQPKGRVFVVGTSAGGYGVELNAARFVDAFPGHEVHLMADSAALVVPAEKLDGWKETWGATEYSTLPPGSRLGLVSSRQDYMISAFTGQTPDDFQKGVEALVDEKFRTTDRAAFIVGGNQHVFFDHLWTGGLVTWLEAWRDGTADFKTTP